MIRNKRIAWSADAGRLPGADDDTFAKELSRLVVKPTIYGFRMDHESGGHDDRSVCAGMGLTTIVEEMAPGGKIGPQVPRPPEPRPGDRQRPIPASVPVRKDWAASRGLFGMGR